MFSQKMKIGRFKLSQKNKSLIIAEIGINHEGNFQKCLDMISNAKKSGADIVKLQIADPQSDYSQKSKSYRVFQSAFLSKEEIYNIYNFAKSKKINIFSTFGRKNFDFFKKINQCCYKISSSLFNDFYFIKDILRLKKPVILSTGVSELKDIDLMLKLLQKESLRNLAILHCRSLYPTMPSKLNLARISYLRRKYDIITGFSDHTKGIEAAAASIHYGSKIIEKHFTFNENRKGYDHQISLNSKNFKKMVDCIKLNESMVGNQDYSLNLNKAEFKKIKKISRSFVILRNIKKNTKLSKNDFSLKRIHNSKIYHKFHQIFPMILKKKLNKNLNTGHILKVNDFKKK